MATSSRMMAISSNKASRFAAEIIFHCCDVSLF
jgi:hypothetical protein